jgi:hypothetical protein
MKRALPAMFSKVDTLARLVVRSLPTPQLADGHRPDPARTRPSGPAGQHGNLVVDCIQPDDYAAPAEVARAQRPLAQLERRRYRAGDVARREPRLGRRRGYQAQ